MIGYSIVVAAWIIATYGIAILFGLLFVVLMLGALVVGLIEAAAKQTRSFFSSIEVNRNPGERV